MSTPGRISTLLQRASCSTPRRALSSSPSFERWLSRRALAREPSPIRALQPLLAVDGMISLGGGMPNPGTFPIAGLSMTLNDDDSTTIALSDAALRAALQYSGTAGLDPLLKKLRDLQAREHRPLDAEHDQLLVTTGSQDALSKVGGKARALVGRSSGRRRERAKTTLRPRLFFLKHTRRQDPTPPVLCSPSHLATHVRRPHPAAPRRRHLLMLV